MKSLLIAPIIGLSALAACQSPTAARRQIGIDDAAALAQAAPTPSWDPVRDGGAIPIDPPGQAKIQPPPTKSTGLFDDLIPKNQPVRIVGPAYQPPQIIVIREEAAPAWETPSEHFRKMDEASEARKARDAERQAEHARFTAELQRDQEEYRRNSEISSMENDIRSMKSEMERHALHERITGRRW